MLLTNDQRFLLDILREVRYMRLDQILPLMRLRDPAKAKSHCEAILRYLRYAGELVPVGDDLVCLAEFRGQEADPEMLCALDILLSLAVGPPLQLTSRRPPYKLCFLLERGRESGKIDAFAVLPVEPGREQLVSILLAQQSQDVTVLCPCPIWNSTGFYISISGTTSSSGRRVACGSLREVRPANDSRSKRTT